MRKLLFDDTYFLKLFNKVLMWLILFKNGNILLSNANLKIIYK